MSAESLTGATPLPPVVEASAPAYAEAETPTRGAPDDQLPHGWVYVEATGGEAQQGKQAESAPCIHVYDCVVCSGPGTERDPLYVFPCKCKDNLKRSIHQGCADRRQRLHVTSKSVLPIGCSLCGELFPLIGVRNIAAEFVVRCFFNILAGLIEIAWVGALYNFVMWISTPPITNEERQQYVLYFRIWFVPIVAFIVWGFQRLILKNHLQNTPKAANPTDWVMEKFFIGTISFPLYSVLLSGNARLSRLLMSLLCSLITLVIVTIINVHILSPRQLIAHIPLWINAVVCIVPAVIYTLVFRKFGRRVYKVELREVRPMVRVGA